MGESHGDKIRRYCPISVRAGREDDQAGTRKTRLRARSSFRPRRRRRRRRLLLPHRMHRQQSPHLSITPCCNNNNNNNNSLGRARQGPDRRRPAPPDARPQGAVVRGAAARPCPVPGAAVGVLPLLLLRPLLVVVLPLLVVRPLRRRPAVLRGPDCAASSVQLHRGRAARGVAVRDEGLRLRF